MNVKEFRKGNLAYLNNRRFYPHLANTVMVVCEIDEQKNGYSTVDLKKLGCKKGKINQLSKFVRPIVLTKDVLNKIGFESFGIDKSSGLGADVRHSLNGFNLYSMSRGLSVYKGYHMEHIRYVHVLQNLYFCKTNKELDVSML